LYILVVVAGIGDLRLARLALTLVHRHHYGAWDAVTLMQDAVDLVVEVMVGCNHAYSPASHVSVLLAPHVAVVHV